VADPAVQHTLDVDLALSDASDRRIRDREPQSMTAAPQQDPKTRERRRSMPGMGPIFRVGVLAAIHALHRCPRVQDCASSGRVVRCAHASAGQRDGTAGHQLGTGHLTWACAAAAVLGLVDHPAGQHDSGRLENTYGPGKAVTVVAHHLARAVYEV
jgi:hypothetical protein